MGSVGVANVAGVDMPAWSICAIAVLHGMVDRFHFKVHNKKDLMCQHLICRRKEGIGNANPRTPSHFNSALRKSPTLPCNPGLFAEQKNIKSQSSEQLWRGPFSTGIRILLTG